MACQGRKCAWPAPLAAPLRLGALRVSCGCGRYASYARACVDSRARSGGCPRGKLASRARCEHPRITRAKNGPLLGAGDVRVNPQQSGYRFQLRARHLKKFVMYPTCNLQILGLYVAFVHPPDRFPHDFL